MLAGVGIVLVAGAVIAVLIARDGGSARAGGGDGGAPPPVAPAAVASVAEQRPRVVAATSTSNVYAQPNRGAEVLAILPVGRDAEVLGRTRDGDWLRVAYPAGSLDHGWVRASALPVDAEALTNVAVVAAPPAVDDGPVAASPERALPDLMIGDAFLLQDGRLAIAIRNVGDAGIVDTLVSLRVARVAGDILGVLQVGPTTLGPGGSATVVTPVVVEEPGSYRLELDAGDEIEERQERNNTRTVLLIPSSQEAAR